MARKTILKVRYPDDPERVWITLDREKKERKERPNLADRLTPEQFYWVQHSKIWARVVLVFVTLFFTMCMRGCNL